LFHGLAKVSPTEQQIKNVVGWGMQYLELSSGTDTGDREADVDGGTDTSEEQFGFQENLA
jgi:hypothetical protein